MFFKKGGDAFFKNGANTNQKKGGENSFNIIVRKALKY